MSGYSVHDAIRCYTATTEIKGSNITRLSSLAKPKKKIYIYMYKKQFYVVNHGLARYAVNGRAACHGVVENAQLAGVPVWAVRAWPCREGGRCWGPAFGSKQLAFKRSPHGLFFEPTPPPANLESR